MPHMITIDAQNNFWVTDVALHQVFKFGPYGGKTKEPLVTLGQRVSLFCPKSFFICVFMALLLRKACNKEINSQLLSLTHGNL